MLAAWTTAITAAPRQVQVGPARVWLRPFYGAYERWLARQVAAAARPRHIGIILDGNRRHGQRHGLHEPRDVYDLGARKLDDVLGWCGELAVPAVTLWVCSTDNLDRPPHQVSGSAHPLALAVVQVAEARSIPIPPARAASAVPGKAAVANVDGVRVTVGSPAFAAERDVDLVPLASRVETLEAEGKIVVVVFARDRVFGVLALRDEPRADAAAAIAALKHMGVASVMLTGDNERTGRAIAGKLGLAVRAHLLPDEKLREIAALKAQGLVVMVGDGINDAPALAAASVGVAMGGGTAAALEAADVALLSGRISGLA